MSVNDVKPGIYVSLIKAASLFATKMKQRVDDNGLPSKIKDSTSVESPVETEGGQSIDIVINTDENHAPMAGAYEWGSGLHRTKGTPEKYPIQAKNAPELHFFWEERGKWFKGFALPFGHPGVAPRPYIQPTIEETEQEILQILATDFKASILANEVRIEVIK